MQNGLTPSRSPPPSSAGRSQLESTETPTFCCEPTCRCTLCWKKASGVEMQKPRELLSPLTEKTRALSRGWTANGESRGGFPMAWCCWTGRLMSSISRQILRRLTIAGMDCGRSRNPNWPLDVLWFTIAGALDCNYRITVREYRSTKVGYILNTWAGCKYLWTSATPTSV
jgi:hypothetical protein